MANQIEVTSLAAQAASSIDGNTQVVAFTQSGDTTRLPLVEAVAYANQVNECICIKEASLTIASADVLTLNTTPIEIVAAPGVGFAIEVLSASFKMVYVTTQYATNFNIQILTSGANTQQLEIDALNASVTTNRTFEKSFTNAPTATQLLENAAVNVTVETGDPTAGDSDITVYVTYRIITL